MFMQWLPCYYCGTCHFSWAGAQGLCGCDLAKLPCVSLVASVPPSLH